MGNYDNVTAKELHEKKMEMMNDLGRDNDICGGIECYECPLNGKDGCSELEADHFDEYVKIIMEYKE